MLKAEFTKICIKTAIARNEKIPDRKDLDFYWSAIGVLGRYSCPKTFERFMLEKDIEAWECFVDECEKLLN